MLTGTTIPGLSEPGSNVNEGVVPDTPLGFEGLTLLYKLLSMYSNLHLQDNL